MGSFYLCCKLYLHSVGKLFKVGSDISLVPEFQPEKKVALTTEADPVGAGVEVI